MPIITSVNASQNIVQNSPIPSNMKPINSNMVTVNNSVQQSPVRPINVIRYWKQPLCIMNFMGKFFTFSFFSIKLCYFKITYFIDW